MADTVGGAYAPPGPISREGWGRRARSRIAAGLVLVLPVWITVLVLALVFRLMRDASIWFVVAVLMSPVGQPLLGEWGPSPQQLADEGLSALPIMVQWGVSVLSVALTAVTLYLLGTVAANAITKRVILLTEIVLDSMPFVKTIYHASKKVMQTFSGGGTRPFRKVVLVPFPNQETHSIGFVTRMTTDKRTGETLYTVFVATTPNPTTGFVMVIRPSSVVELDWTVEEAVKVVMSGGVLMPDTIALSRAGAGIFRE